MKNGEIYRSIYTIAHKSIRILIEMFNARKRKTVYRVPR